jgi:putative inorganic carbon (HCO3(-)) transporter
MSIRDLIIISMFAFFCFKAFKQPYIGVLLMLCITYLSPHRLAPWSLSYSLPFYLIAFVVTAIAFMANNEKDSFPWQKIFILMLCFFVWGAVCTIFAIQPERAMEEFSRSYKLLLGVALILLICQSKAKIRTMIWVIALSIGYYGIKGGVFTLMTGGKWRVNGPPGTYIEGNNELALGVLIIIPLLFFLFTESKIKFIKWGLAAAMVLCFVSVLGSQSRGALLGLIATSAFLWIKSNHKLTLGALGVVAVLIFIPFMPDTWFERMDTIKTYEQDGSAMGRINAWTVAVNVANDRLTGGGYRLWGALSFAIYAPFPEDVHDAHSIYFEVLGEMGWPGLGMYLLLLFYWWQLSGKNAKFAANNPELRWCVTLSKMSQVSQVAYMSAGAFLGLAYWDLPYHLMAVMILTHLHIKGFLEKQKNNAYCIS